MQKKYRNQYVFIHIVKNLSLTKTADLLGLSKATVSRCLHQLEEDWGVELVSRTSRKLKLTAAGQEVYEHCLRLIEDTQRSEQRLMESSDQLTGTLRITASEAFGYLYLSRLIYGFSQQYPGVNFDLLISSDYKSLLGEEIDLAFRIGGLKDSNDRARKLLSTRLGIFAAPVYIEKHGAPQTLDDLQEHNCLIYSGMPLQKSWPLVLGAQDHSHVRGNIRSNNEMYLIETALLGQGLLLFPQTLVEPYLQQQKLHAVLPEHSVPIDIHALYSSQPGLSKIGRLFVDFVTEALQASIH
ncbi:LysR family transcriptional regulator [Thiomicrorhabdus heinhorstiae]|uniref:LysR family transcriptional regulator n=1 Tax=Thiomicrorhabdus heinhorstiae TaxID=2748010 RepID=A0ABS0BWB8_9GAMM|nr:LysR family transcriptional regulator [Thiomicrorhabdus heinhorstiae]MBF6058113.1 LysR family transcriptional regulator [Thiomicrorhabdus heinhorstiae]